MSQNQVLKRILIFDDDADMRTLLRTYLERLFSGVDLEEYDPVASGAPGEDFDWSRYDVLILDYYLCIHGVTGLDILQANRKNPVFPATIMLTGAGNEEVAVRALKLGVYDYLRKEKLNKQELRDSILNAFETHQSNKKRTSEMTSQGQAFNKALFYQQLEYGKEDPEYRKRILLYIVLDDHLTIEERAGAIFRDNIARHIAKQTYEVFKAGQCNPSITRLGDNVVALLIDAPESRKTLDFNINGLMNHLAKRPYRFEEKKFRFTVSIGIVDLGEGGNKADTVLQWARAAVDRVASNDGNSYCLYEREDQQKDAAPAAVKQLPETDRTPPAVDSSQAKPAHIPTVPAAREQPAKSASPTIRADSKDKAAPPAQTKKPTVAPPGLTTTPAVQSDKTSASKSIPATGTGKLPPTSPPAAREVPRTGEELDESKLDEGERRLKKAFDEKRILQLFQPVITLVNTEQASELEIQDVSLQLIDTDGAVLNAVEIQQQIHLPALQKYVDRWILREIIGRLTNSSANPYIFIVRISAASLADATLFNWLRKLLTGLDAKNPGQYIALEISLKDLLALQKQSVALMTYLRKTHNFRFVLGEVIEVDEVTALPQGTQFDLIKCKHDLIHDLQSIHVGKLDDQKTVSANQLETLRSKGAKFIANDIEDATALTDVISTGTEYAMGLFIGEPTPQLDDVTNVESFEIV